MNEDGSAHVQQPPLAAGLIDRDAGARLDPAALDAAWADPAALLLRVHGSELPVRRAGADGFDLAMSPTAGERVPEHLYLGRWEGRPVFAIEIPGVPEGAKNPFPETARVEERSGRETARTSHTAASAGAAPAEDTTGSDAAVRWVHAFEVGAALDDAQRELVAEALALTAWHRTAPFSPRDGEATEIAHGGWVRLDARGGEHFPRTDPAVIVLVEDGDRLLLGSNALWETGRFSLLAGFIDAGESAEQAVVREVAEESGVLVEDVRYVASQPWPFPRSLMLGFRARLAGGTDPTALVADPEEISELRWFSRDELREPPPGIRLPMGMSIAGWLIDQWVAEGDGHRAGSAAAVAEAESEAGAGVGRG